jgi:hypothetical protein
MSMETTCSVSRRPEHDDVRLGFDAGREYRATRGSMEVGVSAKRRLGGIQHAQGARADVLARGAWPWPCAVHDVGARVRVGSRRMSSRPVPRSTATTSMSVRRTPPRVPRGRAEGRARARSRACRRRRRVPVLFHLRRFENAKLPKVATKLKITKNKSCRGDIDLQLSQRVTYVLINGLSGNVGRSWQNSQP